MKKKERFNKTFDSFAKLPIIQKTCNISSMMYFYTFEWTFNKSISSKCTTQSRYIEETLAAQDCGQLYSLHFCWRRGKCNIHWPLSNFQPLVFKSKLAEVVQRILSAPSTNIIGRLQISSQVQPRAGKHSSQLSTNSSEASRADGAQITLTVHATWIAPSWCQHSPFSPHPLTPPPPTTISFAAGIAHTT